MSRPALSASRSFEIIELFASFPERRFTFSEIVKATKINVASCHAILNAMTEKGYLVRSETNKAYQLGPSLVAAGKVAEQGLPLVMQAEKAARQLREDLGCAVMLSTMIGEELLAVLSLKDVAGNHTGMHGGERLPLIAPLGVPFLAWASSERIERWMNQRSIPLDAQLRDFLYEDLRITREQGYHVWLGPTKPRGIGALIEEMAQGRSLENYKEKLSSLIYSFDSEMWRPTKFADDQLYQIILITSPIFDKERNAVYNLGIGGFPQPLTGATITRYAEHLTRVCLGIMRGDRAAANAAAL